MWLHDDLPQMLLCSSVCRTCGCVVQAPVPRLNRAIAEEQLGVDAAARGDTEAAERLYAAAVEVRNATQARQWWRASGISLHILFLHFSHGCSWLQPL